jgi:hypothetical protein
MFGRGGILITIAACALAVSAAAQAPAPTTTAFDGKYVGTATVGRGRATTTCWAIDSMNMTITGGQVVIHAIRSTGNEPTLRGSVNTAGEVSASLQGSKYFHSMSGTIHDKAFTGQRLVAQCYWSVQMQIAPPPTMPFDGDYIGISGGPSKTTSATGAQCGQSGVPDTLTIWNGIVQSDYDAWRGTVSPQGVLVMQHRGATRADGQIDGQGTIRAQGTNSAGCAYTWSWRKQSG